MEATSETAATGAGETSPSADWLAGATLEFGGDVEEAAQVALEGVEFGDGNVA
jgi:hypothetical protein